MKIIYKKGNLLQAKEDVIIHGCNAQGVMGAGVAKAIATDCPGAYKEYYWWCKNNEPTSILGSIMWYFCNNANMLIGKRLGNAITQKNYGRNKKFVSYSAIRKVMQHLNAEYTHYNYYNCENFDPKPIAMPKIGAGLAGGDWAIISDIIEKELTCIQPIVYYLK